MSNEFTTKITKICKGKQKKEKKSGHLQYTHIAEALHEFEGNQLLKIGIERINLHPQAKVIGVTIHQHIVAQKQADEEFVSQPTSTILLKTLAWKLFPL